MSSFRVTPRRLAGTLLISVLLFGCDTQTPIEVADTLTPERTGVQDQVPLAIKEAALRPSARGVAPPNISPMFYGAEQIPYEAGPTNLANQGPTGDDQILADVPIGFEFQFYGNDYSTLHISSNGFVRFGQPVGDSGCCSGRPIPENDAWNNLIAVAWTDLNPAQVATGEIRYETLGTEPNRRFVVHYNDVTIWPNSDPRLNAWLILYEGSNVIEIHTDFLIPGTQNITQGIENIDGSIAHYIEGRVATVFSLEDDGVRFTPEEVTEVDIERAYSGDPPRPDGIVNIDDEWVYVEILDPLSYRPMAAARGGMIPFQSADDVRIGNTWESGVPAESYELLDLGGGPEIDIRLRWDLQELRDAGRLPLGETTLTVWGRDSRDDLLYRGEVDVLVERDMPEGVCWDNGDFVTHPDGGTGPIAGQDVSMSDPVHNTAGSNVLLQPGGPHFRIADDFRVGEDGCQVVEVVTYGYQTGGTPSWTRANLNIREGSVDGPIVASATTTTWEFTGVYRTFNAVLNNADRPIYQLIFNFTDVNLTEGSYWIDWQIEGGPSAWAPYVTLPPSTPGGSDTETVFQNGMQLTDLGWQPNLAPPGAESPFLVLEPEAERQPAQGRPQTGRSLRLPGDYASRIADRAQ